MPIYQSWLILSFTYVSVLEIQTPGRTTNHWESLHWHRNKARLINTCGSAEREHSYCNKHDRVIESFLGLWGKFDRLCVAKTNLHI